MSADAAGPVEELTRWERSGGHWRVLSRGTDEVVVGLVTCDGGTEMGRVVGSPAELDPYLAGRTTSED